MVCEYSRSYFLHVHGLEGRFLRGYDHAVKAGIVHYANHHISPGKKQWTWGNHEFGYAWDRNLTDADGRGEFGPYIEIMAGVYTDNQPDFSFLQPGETKSWSQYWYPIREIGPAQHANLEAAISLGRANGQLQLGVAVTRKQPKAVVTITAIRAGHTHSPTPAMRLLPNSLAICRPRNRCSRRSSCPRDLPKRICSSASVTMPAAN